MRVQTEFASGEVADRDLKRVLNSSLSELSQPDDAILHAIPMHWSVDGEIGIEDPRGMYGKSLGVDSCRCIKCRRTKCYERFGPRVIHAS